MSQSNRRILLHPDAIAENRVQRLVQNLNSLRQTLARGGNDLESRRNLEDECDYPKDPASITARQYRLMYDSEGVPTRVVEIMPAEAWKSTPEVYESEDVERETAFEEAWNDLPRQLRGGSLYAGQQGNPVWQELRTLDIRSSICTFGLLLLGLDDGLPLSEPTRGVEEQNSVPVYRPEGDRPTRTNPLKPAVNRGRYDIVTNAEGRRLLYLRSYDESMVTVAAYESNPTSPRYGWPTAYDIELNDPLNSGYGGSSQPNNTVRVHWTRVIHVSAGYNNDVFGVPEMRPVWNRLLDIRKIQASSGEGFWRELSGILALETHPQLGGDVEVDTEDLLDQVEQLFAGMQRAIVTKGMSAKKVAGQVTDPTAHLNAKLEEICVCKGIPIRLFKGSERGELSSSQDVGTWNGRLLGYQNSRATPKIVVPFIDRLIMVGVLPKPEEYFVQWPDLESLTEMEKAQLSVTRTQALAAYVQGGVESLIPPMDYLTRVHDLPQDEAEEILQGAAELAEDRQADLLEQQRQQATMAGTGEGSEELLPAEEPQEPKKPPFVKNVFCATGEGGGVDPSCGATGVGGQTIESKSSRTISDQGLKPNDAMTAAVRMSAFHKKPVYMYAGQSGVQLTLEKPEVPPGTKLVSFSAVHSKGHYEVERTVYGDKESKTHNVFCATREGDGADPID